MTTLHDTLTSRLAELKAERAEMDANIENLERHLRMGKAWIIERAESMMAVFSHLFPAAHAEPLVDTSPLPLVTGEPLPPAIKMLDDEHEALTFHALPTVTVNGVGTTGRLTTDLPLTTLIETKTYSDSTTATGVAPLPEKSPAQQEADDALDRMHG